MIGLFLQGRFLDLHLHDLSGQFIQLGRHGIHLRFDHSAGFVHQVDGLVRKEPVRNVTIGKNGCGNQGGVCDLYSVINLVPFL